MIKADNFPIGWVRSQFPAVLAGEKEQPRFAFMDNAGGSQVPDASLKAIADFFIERNVNHGGSYRHSQKLSASMDETRSGIAGFLGASSPDEIIFGHNATTLIRLLATSLRETLSPGDEIILSTLDHEANITPWLRLQQEGIKIQFWNPRGPDALLQLGDLKALLSRRTRLVAVCGASNLLGTVNDLRPIADLAHESGAILFVDGVHYAPHRHTNVSRDDIDVFVCSGYKIFGAHIGFAACKRRLLEQLPSLNHYFLKDKLKFELGTQNFEGLAATDGVLSYFSSLAKELGIDDEKPYQKVFEHIVAYEKALSERLIGGLLQLHGVRVYGITDPDRFDMRTPTAAFTVENHSPLEIATLLGKAGFGVNDGDLYAARIVDWLRLRQAGGVVRASLCHYNTIDEIERLLDVLASIK